MTNESKQQRVADRYITIGFNSDLFLRHPMTGISNYCFQMIRAQQELDQQVGYLGFTGVGWKDIDETYLARVASDHGKNFGIEAKKPGLSRRVTATAIETLAQMAARVTIARILYRSLRSRNFTRTLGKVSQKIDLFNAFNFQPHGDIEAPILPVIYDLSFVRYPEAHPKERLKLLEAIPETIARAPLVQTISQFSKNEIVSVYGYPENRIIIAPPAASSIFRILGAEVTRRDLGPLALEVDSYFLAVGTLEPRKNIKILIEAYAQLPPGERAHCPLVLVGGKGWGHLDLPPQTENLIQSGCLRFLGIVSDTTLRSLYEGAKILLFPSIYEGFGMPVVEALACGTAVAHSGGTSMDEISGETEIRVPATDVQAWVNVMLETAGNSRVDTDEVRRARITQAKTFDWYRSAATVLDGYRRIVG
ncbi:MAG TPA: glycosyltransferase family 1 protein [Rhizobium sp.]